MLSTMISQKIRIDDLIREIGYVFDRPFDMADLLRAALGNSHLTVAIEGAVPHARYRDRGPRYELWRIDALRRKLIELARRRDNALRVQYVGAVPWFEVNTFDYLEALYDPRPPDVDAL
jgi:hypothetical protein